MELKAFFEGNPKVALAFSGGVDSSYLLYAARESGARVKAYFVKTMFQPRFELEDAKKLVNELGAELEVLEADILTDQRVTGNDPLRCYYCKQAIFSGIIRRAAADGYPLVIDGSNASDDAGDRPGMRALRELGVRSPLRDAGLTKAQIRELSKKAGLFTWSKPAYACLATRIRTGDKITREILERLEAAEDRLFGLGFTDFRVRVRDGNDARLEIPEGQMAAVFEKRREIYDSLSKYFGTVTLDLSGKR
ncbi:MAG: ATP-dependent sacrificial sulfur transferase LarE [Oscillospiraceae bacterium]|jgi:uncharacterized protein|nr:ATP-dependent sacrificial sulfur transferase LarE [Oscillospiraceae bacterium]